MSGRCVPPRNGSFSIDDVAGLHGRVIDGRAHRQRHRAQVHRHVVALRDRLAVGVVDGARVVEPLLDVGREAGAAQRDAHLLGDGDEQVLEDLELDGIDALHFGATGVARPVQPRRSRRMRLPNSSTRKRKPGGTTAVASPPATTAGPSPRRAGRQIAPSGRTPVGTPRPPKRPASSRPARRAGPAIAEVATAASGLSVLARGDDAQRHDLDRRASDSRSRTSAACRRSNASRKLGRHGSVIS